jgi:peptidoglycan/LPS O-acetylase OafA/YrhL
MCKKYTAAMQRHKLRTVQLLRALAAMGVLLHHVLPHYQAMGGQVAWMKYVGKWGFAGVDLFFLISGYIMAYTTFEKKRGLHTLKAFLKHRFARIYLGYWPFFTVMLLLICIGYPYKLDKIDIIGSFFLIQPDMFKLVLPVSWSLTYELYFYVLFALTLFLPFYAGVSMFLLYAVGVVYAQYMGLNSFFLSALLLELFAGVFLFVVQKYIPSSWLILSVFIALAIFFYSLGIVYACRNGWLRTATFGAGAFFLLAVAVKVKYETQQNIPYLPVAIGDASYTLYLSHLIIFELFSATGLRDLFEEYDIPLVGAAVYVLAAVVFSLLYYRKVEKPLYKYAVGFRAVKHYA